MKNFLFCIALLAMSFTTLSASAKKTDINNVKSEKEFKKVETKNVFSKKLVTYKIDNPIIGNISISVPENAFNCGGSFPVYYLTDEYGFGMTTMYFGCETTFNDILKDLLRIFFRK
jgi:hypothetical protein